MLAVVWGQGFSALQVRLAADEEEAAKMILDDFNPTRPWRTLDALVEGYREDETNASNDFWVDVVD